MVSCWPKQLHQKRILANEKKISKNGIFSKRHTWADSRLLPQNYEFSASLTRLSKTFHRGNFDHCVVELNGGWRWCHTQFRVYFHLLNLFFQPWCCCTPLSPSSFPYLQQKMEGFVSDLALLPTIARMFSM